jgi:hypothetical protein
MKAGRRVACAAATATVVCGCGGTPLASGPGLVPVSALEFRSPERPATAPRPVQFTADREGATLLRLDYAGRVGIQHTTGSVVGLESAYRLEPVCRAPCDATLEPGAWYVVGGGDIARTEAFRVPEDATSLRVRAGGSQTAREFGVGATLAGGFVVLLGAGGLAFHDDPGVATGMLVTGAVTAGVGVLLWILNRPTSIEFGP